MENKGERCIRFIESLIVPSGNGAGKPFCLPPWQKKFVTDIFGTIRDADGLRQYRKAFLFVPRKNGKTTLTACLALYGLIADGEIGAQIILAANSINQASQLFETCVNLINANKYLKQILKIKTQTKEIDYKKTHSKIKVISADGALAHGLNPSMVIYDELHASPKRDLYTALITSQGARQQPLFFIITTAGDDKNSVCFEEYEYAKKVRDKIIQDDSYYPAIFEAPEGTNPLSIDSYKACNPNWGVSIFPEFIEGRIREGKEKPLTLLENRQLHLNQWVETNCNWLNPERWEACYIPNYDYSRFHGQECFAGLDCGAVQDLTAFVRVFKENDIYYILPQFFAPKEKAKHRQERDRVPYLLWANQNHLTLHDGDVVSSPLLRQAIRDSASQSQILSIAYDSYGLSETVVALKDNDGLSLEPYRQGFGSMSNATKLLETLVIQKRIVFSNPVLRWMGIHCQVTQDEAGNIKPAKKKSRDRIDGIVALVMALGMYLRRDNPEIRFLC